MSYASSATTPLVDTIWAPSGHLALPRAAVLAVTGSILLALSARVQIPMWPVPVTMQTFAVLLIALSFGPRLAVATVALYLIEGAAGLPVFAAGGGLAYFAGPTAGYLFSYLAVAMAVGSLGAAGWGRSPLRVIGAMLLGSAIIYLLGAGWLAVSIGWEKALLVGVVPFLVGDVLKACLAAAMLPTAWALSRR